MAMVEIANHLNLGVDEDDSEELLGVVPEELKEELLGLEEDSIVEQRRQEQRELLKKKKRNLRKIGRHQDAGLPFFTHGPRYQTHWETWHCCPLEVSSNDLPLERQKTQILWMKPPIISRPMSSSKTMKLRIKLIGP